MMAAEYTQADQFRISRLEESIVPHGHTNSELVLYGKDMGLESPFQSRESRVLAHSLRAAEECSHRS